ncbi:MAG: MFS transporter [Desulfovibrio sp.]|nr:MFS transporter [Desulfovibrio sp.]
MNDNPSASKTALFALLPVLFCFLTMGFVDVVGIATNYVQKDLQLTDSQANIFPSLVFFWFLIFSIPSSLLMNKIGRRNTVLLSVAITLFSMIIPLFGDSYGVMLAAFSLLGIGNAIMQTSLNPLVSNIVSKEKLPSSLTFGQFIKAIASFFGPLLCAWGAAEAMPTFGYGWRGVFVVYAIAGAIALLWLGVTPVPREKSDKVSGFKECMVLLANPLVLLSFIGIMCHVGIDVGTNTSAPRILMERCGLALEEAGYATSLYFICRTLGSLAGAALLQKMPAKIFFLISAVMLACGLCGCIFLSSQTGLYISVALLGLGNSNIFPVILSQCILRMPNEANEVSGLMVMGLFGGTVFPLIMGFASEMFNSQNGAVIVMLIAAIYLICYTKVMRSENV